MSTVPTLPEDPPDAASVSLRERLYREFAPGQHDGLSLTNRVLAVVILLSVVLGVVGTEPVVQDRFGPALLMAEMTIGAIFVTELCLRLWAMGVEPRYAGVAGALRYLRRPLTIIDLIVIITLIAPMFGAEFVVLRLLRLLRLVALAKFGQYSVALQTLGRAVRNRRYELSLSIVIASLVVLLSATGMYLLESEAQPEAFGSIPRALWWSVATLTTVGYGDVYPLTAVGRLFAGVTAVAGIGLIALPAGILASAFSELSSKSE